ncbi:hypothetical protein BJ742DRAFT_682158, partial [Cladochytrium replicatum]
QHVRLRARQRGCHLVVRMETTYPVIHQLPELRKFQVGMANIFIQHTSASLTINENYDIDVRRDMEMMLNRIAPENAPYTHTMEGSDDMPGHVKSSLFGVSLQIPVENGQLALGTWQGMWLCEHRNSGGARNIVVTVQGITKQ